MSFKKTALWLFVAAGLFAFIRFYHLHRKIPAEAPSKVLPELSPEDVTSILVRPSGPVQLQIRADRTNGVWELRQPLIYPAQPERVQKLLAFLEQLKPAPYLSGSEMRTHANADEEFGFANPQATIVIEQGPYHPRLRVGALTPPGDQVYVQVEGDLGAYVVDAGLLRYLPHSADDWRDTSLVKLETLVFDKIGVTNNAKGDPAHPGLPASSSTFVLQQEPTNHLWRMVWPLDARANNTRIDEALTKFQKLRVRKFVSDAPKPDLESFGLAPAELELGFTLGTNNLGSFQFGRSPTNDASEVYARKAGQSTVVTVSKDLLLNWCGVLNDFRDPHLLSLPNPPESLEFVNGTDHSSIQRQADGSWRIAPEDLPADERLVADTLATLTNTEIAKFVNDIVNPADLPQYGLAPPLYRVLTKISPGSPGADTNATGSELDFGQGTNLTDKVFARRTDESFVYGISSNDFAKLPTGAWKLRDRTLCRFSVADVSGLTLRDHGKICQMIHKAPLSWTFAPGSQGIINDGAVEETIRGVVQAKAILWVGRGAQDRAGYGFIPEGPRLSLELKDGGRFDLEFGREAPLGNIYASVVLEGQPWILEFPGLLFRDIALYLPLQPEH
jgi:hypothetical protein